MILLITISFIHIGIIYIHSHVNLYFKNPPF